MEKGHLYLIPNTLGDTDLSKILPQRNLDIIMTIKDFIVEDLKMARRFLSKAGWRGQIETLNFYVLNEHSRLKEIKDHLLRAENGHHIGLLSDAGVPCVADPGADIVAMAHKKGIQIIPLVGPSSILLSLMASGFNGQNFSFLGYLARDRKPRENNIKEVEKNAYKLNQTQIFIEAPYRNNHMLESLLNTCDPSTKICVARDITLKEELIISQTVAEWRKLKPLPELHKRNTIFLLYK